MSPVLGSVKVEFAVQLILPRRHSSQVMSWGLGYLAYLNGPLICSEPSAKIIEYFSLSFLIPYITADIRFKFKICF